MNSGYTECSHKNDNLQKKFNDLRENVSGNINTPFNYSYICIHISLMLIINLSSKWNDLQSGTLQQTHGDPSCARLSRWAISCWNQAFYHINLAVIHCCWSATSRPATSWYGEVKLKILVKHSSRSTTE